MGPGENLEPGRVFSGPGFRVFPQCVSGLVPLLPVYSRSRAVVFPTSPLGGHPDLPLAAAKQTPWLSQSVTGFASQRTATLPELPADFVSLKG
jgi:hypothetical protein